MNEWLRNSHLESEGIDYEGQIEEELPSLGSVTCFYNEEDIAGETLERLNEAAEQSELYETVYAVDDGSEDNTAEIIEHYAEELENIEFIEMEENTGKFGAQKAATDIMDEDYWLTIDADSYIQNPEDIDDSLMKFDQSDSAAAMLNMEAETAGDGLISTAYEKMQNLEYSMRKGIDDFTSNGNESKIVTASGTATLGKT